MKTIIKKILPDHLFKKLLSFYHQLLAFISAVRYRFPSRELIVIGVTGTKGKTTTTELIAKIFENAGYKTALSNSLRFKVGHSSFQNKTHTSMPGRFILQKLMRDAVRNGCDVFVLEMTSEGGRQFRHRHINLDAFVFLNIAPEHIESHGSYENYVQAKKDLADSLIRSTKKRKVLLLNRDYEESKVFLSLRDKVSEVYTFSLKDAEPYRALSDGVVFRLEGEDIRSSLPGEFNIKNAVAGSAVARVFDIPQPVIKKTLTEFKGIRGRVEKVEADVEFDIYVDFAHTPDSFEAIFKSFPTKRIISVFGSTGGGRDTWKRPVLGKIADTYSSEIFLTTEDPYDEDPQDIVDEILKGIKNTTPRIVIDRREAIHEALKRGRTNTVVLILGKGAEPYQMLKDGEREWSDVRVVQEELQKIKLEEVSQSTKDKEGTKETPVFKD